MQPALSIQHLEAPLDGKQLWLQAEDAFELLSEAAKVNKNSQFWHSINSTVDLRNKVSVWCKLASWQLPALRWCKSQALFRGVTVQQARLHQGRAKEQLGWGAPECMPHAGHAAHLGSTQVPIQQIHVSQSKLS